MNPRRESRRSEDRSGGARGRGSESGRSGCDGGLRDALEEQFYHESERSLLRIREAVAPYTRFVGAERDRVQAMRDRIDDAKGRMQELRQCLEAL